MTDEQVIFIDESVTPEEFKGEGTEYEVTINSKEELKEFLKTMSDTDNVTVSFVREGNEDGKEER